MPRRLSRLGAARPRFLDSVVEGFAVVAFFTLVAVFATWPLAISPLGGFGGFGQGLGTYNFQIFSSFALAGCTMYLAARYLTGSRAAALVAGFAYTFSPFHLSLAMQYNALAS